MKEKKRYLSIGVMSFILSLLLFVIYRPFVIQNNILDYGFSDVIGSFFSVFTCCSFIWGIKTYSEKDKNFQIVVATFVFAFFWEFLGYINIYGTYDIKDIVAGVLSGCIAYFLKFTVKKSQKTNQFQLIEISQDRIS